jgi:hypothetical protein
MGGRPLTLTGRVRRWFADLGFHQMWQVGVVVLLAATALFGGLDNADTEVTEFKPGEKFSDGQFTLTVDRATLVTELASGGTVMMPARQGRRYLGVVADVRNDGTVPGTLQGELDLRDESDTKYLGTVRMADGSPIVTLGPGLGDQLAFVWDVPDDALHAGDSVTLRVWKKQFKEYTVTYSQAWTYSLTKYGQVSVPVKVAP